jgi:hypothetical protein
MGWIRKAIGPPKQASKVLADAREDVKRPAKDEVAAKRQQKNGGKR